MEMPWRVARNFIRAFCPTLIVLLLYDLLRNLSHPSPTRVLGLFADVVALGIVAFIKLTPPFGGMRKEFAYLFRWFGWFGVCLLFDNLSGLSPQKFFLLVAGYAFYSDMAKVCKTSWDDSERIVKSFVLVVGLASFFVYGLWRICQSVIPLKGLLNAIASMSAALVIIALLGWWAVRRTGAPTVQELKLNE